MLKTFERISTPYLAYVLLLLGFAFLGIFVAALADGSELAAVVGAALAACVGASVAGFRASARRLASRRASDGPLDKVSIFSTPLRGDQIERYLQSYRSGSDSTAQTRQVLTLIGRDESTDHRAWRASGSNGARDDADVPGRLSA